MLVPLEVALGFEPLAEKAASEHAKYERICSLCTGPIGELALGRARGQGDASRFVTLRPLPLSNFDRIEATVRQAANIAHPRLTKVLGLAWLDEAPYLASEYVDGLSAGELARELRCAETSVIQEVALRISLDALIAVSAARTALRERGLSELPRCLYPDTAWIATFGETLLSDVGVAAELASLNSAQSDCLWSAPRGRTRNSAKDDVFAAGALLFELLSGRSLASVRANEAAPVPALDDLPRNGRPIAKQLVELVARALAVEPKRRFEDAEQMLQAILALPSHWIGSEAQVEAAIETLAHRATDLRASEPSLELTSGEHEADELWEIPTRSLRLRLPNEDDDRLTLRPEETRKL